MYGEGLSTPPFVSASRIRYPSTCPVISVRSENSPSNAAQARARSRLPSSTRCVLSKYGVDVAARIEQLGGRAHRHTIRRSGSDREPQRERRQPRNRGDDGHPKARRGGIRG